MYCKIPIKQNQQSVCISVQSLQPVAVNVKVVSVPVRVFCLAKPIFLTVDTDTQVYCSKNNNDIANSHLPLTNLFPSSETKSSFYFIFGFKSWLDLTFQNVLSIYLKSHVLQSIIMFLHHWSFLCFLWHCLLLWFYTSHYKMSSFLTFWQILPCFY